MKLEELKIRPRDARKLNFCRANPLDRIGREPFQERNSPRNPLAIRKLIDLMYKHLKNI